MNAIELQTFNKKTRRRLFAWEVLAAIHTNTLKHSKQYFDSIDLGDNDNQCHACAIGAAYVFKNDWKILDNSMCLSFAREESVKDMRDMGFSDRDINIIEYVFEGNNSYGLNPISPEDEELYKPLKEKIHANSPDRTDRMRDIYQTIFDSSKGRLEVNK